MKSYTCLFAITLLLVLSACGRRAQPVVGRRPALTVSVVAPVSESWPERVHASGSIAAWQESVIGSEISGVRLDEVLVNVGDVVRKGQLLATFNPDTTRADLAQSQAAVAESEANEALARDQAKRAQQLEAAGTLSQQDLVQFQATQTTSTAKLASARAQLDMQRLKLSYTRVISPDDGVISARSATVGAVVANGSELFRLIRKSKLEWRAEVASEDLAKIAPGTTAEIQLPGGGTASGSARASSPQVDTDTRTGRVYVDLTQPGALKAGMFVAGNFLLPGKMALHVPESALVYRDGYQYVVEILQDSKARQIKVTTGRREGLEVEILQGLSTAARIVRSGASFLTDGDTVLVR